MEKRNSHRTPRLSFDLKGELLWRDSGVLKAPAVIKNVSTGGVGLSISADLPREFARGHEVGVGFDGEHEMWGHVAWISEGDNGQTLMGIEFQYDLVSPEVRHAYATWIVSSAGPA